MWSQHGKLNLGYYYPVLCTIIKTLAANDETIVTKIGLVAACSLRTVYGNLTGGGGGGGVVLRGQHGNLQLFVKINKRLARISAWGLSSQV